MRLATADKALLVGATALGIVFAWRMLAPIDIPRPHAVLNRLDSTLYVGDYIGNPTAVDRVVVFTDYECPACQRLDANLDSLVRDAADSVAVLYRHFPGPQNDYSKPAARAAICAGKQGQFAAYHRALLPCETRLE